jgi:hypothetical protein
LPTFFTSVINSINAYTAPQKATAENINNIKLLLNNDESNAILPVPTANPVATP